MKIVRVILDRCVDEASVGSAGWDLQWSLSEYTKAEGTIPKQVTFYEEDENGETTFIKYTEDFYIDLPYIEIYSKNPSSIEIAAKDIQKKLPTYTVSEAFEMVKNAKDREELFLAIRYLGIGCGGQPPTPELLQLFYDLAYDPDPDVRHTATIAMGYTAWAEFFEPLEYLAQNQPIPSRREYAAHILWALKKNVLQEPVS